MEETVEKNFDSMMFEVCFQNHTDAKVDKEIVFSRSEAEKAVLNFYNKVIAETFEHVSPLQTYEEIELFRSQYAKDFPGSAWFEKVQPTVAADLNDSDKVYEFSPPDPSSSHYELFKNLILNLSQTLKAEGISLPAASLQEVVSRAFSNSFPEDDLLPDTHLDKIAEKEEMQAASVLLVFVGDEEAAVYFGDEYIDSANTENGEELQMIVETANMLAEKYGVELKKHRFKAMDKDWSWTRVEQILKSTGMMPSDRKNLLELLLKRPSIEMANVTILGFDMEEPALNAFKEKGDGSEDFLFIHVQRDLHKYNVILTVDEVVKAVEIAENRWACADPTSTEILLT